eukprot:jgi/Pico_ML_1/51653/g230.t1
MERMSACPRVAATARRSASACRASSHDQASRATQGRVAASHSARFHVLLGGVEEEDHATRIVGRAVLAYIAAEMGSFVFLKELVAVVHRAYDDGVPLLRLKVEAAALNMESGFVEPVFTQQQLEIFTSWMAIIYVTIALRTVKEDWDSENTGKMEAFERSISNPFLEADSPTVLFMRQQATLAILARDFGRGTGQ